MKLLQCVMLVALAAPAMAQVTVEEIEYKGWARSIEIDNPDVRLVVVPAIGRIMHYGFVGAKTSSVRSPTSTVRCCPTASPTSMRKTITCGPTLAATRSGPISRANLSKSTATLGRPTTLSTARYTRWSCCRGGGDLSPVSEYNGARSVREIRLAEQGTRVEILPADRKTGRCQGRTVCAIPFGTSP